MKKVFQDTEQYFKVTAFYALSLPKYHMKCHTHRSMEIMYITAGECTVFCGETEVRLRANQFIFISPEVPHQLEISEECPCSVLNLEFILAEEESPVARSFLLKKIPHVQRLWTSEEDYVVSNDSRSMGYAMKDLLFYLQSCSGNVDAEDFLFCLLFCRTVMELLFCMETKKNNQGISYLKKACDYIDRQFMEDIHIPEIAAYVGINKSYLQALFSERMGCTINTYINHKRLEQAAFLLCNSSLTITDIAFSSGYNSRQHFAHTFEKFYQISPSAYRTLHSRSLMTDTENLRYSLVDGNCTEVMK